VTIPICSGVLEYEAVRKANISAGFVILRNDTLIACAILVVNNGIVSGGFVDFGIVTGVGFKFG
jgi:hypothetical protein